MLAYKAFGVTAQGASHIKNEMPNQDAYKCYASPSGEFAITAVCDGHGSKKYMRSDIGARIAAEQAIILLREFAENEAQPNQLVREDDLNRLKKNILFYWQQKVQEYTKNNPFTEKESTIANSLGIDESSTVAYGTTLVAVLITRKYVLCLQIGDGDIIFLQKDDTLVNVMQEDKRLLANETTSLCGDRAIYDFRQYISEEIPSTVLICTDGVTNSYISHKDFINLTRDIQEELTKSGEQATLKLLDSGLKRMSANGSGDDVTIAVIYQE